MSSQNGHEDRKARLAALRKNRFQKQPEKAAENHHSEPQVSEEPNVIEQEQESSISGQLTEPPRLQLDNNETVEVISQKIQRDILQAAQEKANSATIGSTAKEAKPKTKYTKDLEEEIREYSNKAALRTERAVYKIIQAKYESLAGEETEV